MHFWIPFAAAVGCAICNGVAAVLQKVGADAETPAETLHAGLFLRLLRHPLYVSGIALDVVAWILTLVAVHSLPLFLVQSVIASNIVITALVEHFVLHRPLRLKTYAAIFVALIGLVCLSLAAKPGGAAAASHAARTAIIFAPLLLVAFGAIFVRSKGRSSAIALAALAGVAFGGTSIVGRIIAYPHPVWHVVADPLAYALVAYGAIAIMLFTIALQRSLATKANAIMVTFETLAPAIVGVALFSDSAKAGLWPLALAGAAFVILGCLVIACNATQLVGENPIAGK